MIRGQTAVLSDVFAVYRFDTQDAVFSISARYGYVVMLNVFQEHVVKRP